MTERILSPRQLELFRENLLREEKSSVTIEKYMRDVSAFYDYSTGNVVSKELTVEYKKYLVEKGYAIRSVNSMLASLNSFLSFLGWTDCRVKNLRLQRQTYSTENKELSKAEYMRLLKASEKRQQLNLLLQTICCTGIRVSELKYFTVEAILCGEISVQCKSKTRTILIPGKLRKMLLAYARKNRIKSGIIFATRSGRPLDRSNIWAQMKSLCAVAGVEPSKVFPHNLRKLFARTFYRAERDIAKLADILGHSSIDTTRIYIMTSCTEHRRMIERLGLLV